MPDAYTVKVSGPGLEMTQDVDQGLARRVVGVLMGWATGTTAERQRTEPKAGVENNVLGTDVAIGEFISDLNITNNAERIAAIALYMSEQCGERLVAREVFPAWFQRSGEAPPKNFVRDLKTAVSRKLVSEDHSRAGYYFVTKTGIDRLRGSVHSLDGAPRTRDGQTRTQADSATGDNDRDKSAAGKRVRRSATSTGKGPSERILDLKAAGWFREPKTLQGVINELSRLGANYKRTDLTRQMQTLTQRGDLVRRRQTPSKGGRAVWHYSAA